MAAEADDAAFYEAHKDDPAIWGEPVDVEQASTHRRLSATITVRFTPSEADAIREWARASGQTYTEIVRDAVNRAMQRPHRIDIARTE